MTLVDHDEVEEVGGQLAEDLLALRGSGDCLIQTEVDLVRGVDAPGTPARGARARFRFGFDRPDSGRQFGHDRTERAKVVDHGLIDQHVAVGQEEDAFLATGSPQPPHDLEDGVGLAGPRRHDQQDAFSAAGDGFDGGVDGVHLVVPRFLVAAVVKVVLEEHRLRIDRQSLPGAITRPQVFRGREGAEVEGGFSLGAAPCPVVKTKPSPLEENVNGMFRVSA